MTTRRPALGKGLSALLGNGDKSPSPVAVPPAHADEAGLRRVREVPLDRIAPNRHQARKRFDDATLAELAASIRESGILQPLTVRPHPERPDRYEIIAGERRFRAAKLAGLKTVPALVLEADEQNASVLSLVENLQREDLNAIDEAQGYQALIDGFDFTQEEIADRVGKSRSAVANALRLLHLPETVRTGVAEGRLSAGHARALLALVEPDEILSAYGDVLGSQMSVRETERHVQRLLEAREKMRKTARTVSPKAALDPNWEDLMRRLRERFGTKLAVSGSEKKGKVEIYYFSQEDRNRILDLLTGD